MFSAAYILRACFRIAHILWPSNKIDVFDLRDSALKSAWAHSEFPVVKKYKVKILVHPETPSALDSSTPRTTLRSDLLHKITTVVK
jgi:hypothetical protein